jgi:hypothetical protein
MARRVLLAALVTAGVLAGGGALYAAASTDRRAPAAHEPLAVAAPASLPASLPTSSPPAPPTQAPSAAAQPSALPPAQSPRPSPTQQAHAPEQPAPAPPPDTEPPTAPTNLTGVNAGNDVDNLRVVLDWDASSDDVGVAGYRIYRDGVQVHVVDDGSTDDTDWPRCGHVYDYAVRAYDAAGNLSEPAEVTVSTVCYSG